MHENDITKLIIGASIEVHKELGPGLLESVYEHCLVHELLKLGLDVQRQFPLPVVYKGERLDVGFRIDLWVNEKVIVEVKTVEKLTEVHLAQILTYLKLSKCKLGLLINFNELKLINGIRRVANQL
jgi:GxxExxY protein